MISWLEKNRFEAWFFTFLFAIEIFWISSIPGKVVTRVGISWPARVYHFSIFFIFTFFLFIAIKGKKKLEFKQILIVLLISFFYAWTDEFHQSFIPGRSCTFEDYMTDILGITSAIAVYLYTLNKRKE